MANTTSGTATFEKGFSIADIVEESYERIGIHEVRRWISELNILVVEDDEVLRESFQQQLS